MGIQILTPQELAPYAERLARGESAPSAGEMFFGDDLTQDLADLFRQARPNLTLRDAIYVDSSVATGAREVRARVITGAGAAGWQQPGAVSFPTVELGASAEDYRLYPFGVRLSWSDAEQQAAVYARSKGSRGVPDFYGELYTLAQRTIAEFSNRVGWLGDAARNLAGIGAAPIRATKSTVTIAEGTSDTGVAIVKALAAAHNDVITATKGLRRPNRLLLSITSHAFVSTELYSAETGPRTIMEQLRAILPGVEIMISPDLQSVTGANGVALGGCALFACHDRFVARQVATQPRPYKIVERDGGVYYDQVLMATVSPLIWVEPNAYALLTNIHA